MRHILNMDAKTSILLSHGSGGKLQADLLESIIFKHIKNPVLSLLEDSARLGKLAFTTDSYVVKPLFFPGGNIGKLAVSGTVNDLLCVGAKPLYISLGLIIEEGFEFDVLEKIIVSAADEAKDAGVKIVCGDTKVVEHGKGDGIYINTSGIGEIRKPLSPQNIEIGDYVIITGTIGDHGMALMSERENLGLKPKIISDVANLAGIAGIIFKDSGVHCMRDPTRGGLGGILKEIALKRNISIEIDESAIPVRPEVIGVCELLGIEPLYVANEGKFVIFSKNPKVVDSLKRTKLGKNASFIGRVTGKKKPGEVIMKTKIGGKRFVELPRGELLPRIC